MNDLQKAIKKRDDFLKENPHLIEHQQAIDEIMDKCRSEDRLAVISMLMMQNMIDLQRETLKLKEII
jgi:hypothetical protein